MGTYSLDGFPLDDAAGRWFLDADTGVRVLPSRRASSAVLPGRDGVVFQPGASFDSGSVALSLVIGGGDHGVMMGTLELLNGVMGQRNRLLPLVHDYGNGQKRVIDVQVIASVEPELVGHADAVLKIVARAPSVFWRDQLTVDATADLTSALTSTDPTVLTQLAGSTAPINDAIIRLKGAFSGVTLTDPVSGDQLIITTALTATEYLVIDTANWVARKHATDSWSLVGGSNAITSVVSNRGSGPMFSLNPDFIGGAGRVRIATPATTRGSYPTATVRAKRSFL